MQVVELSGITPHELDRIFQQEARCWERQLFWDFQPTVSLIKRYILAKSLSGWALRDESGRLSGYTYYVVNRPVGYIGTIFVRSEQAAPDVYSLLLEKALESLDSSSRLTRIESQIFAFNCDLVPLFQGLGFRVMKRHFLCLDLSPPGQENTSPPLPAGFRITEWNDQLLLPVSDIIYKSYRGSPDQALCHDYQSRDGCARFVRNLVQHPGCGIFSRETSYLGLDPKGAVCAALLTSRIRPDTGMVPQVSVRSDCQGKGLGSHLLDRYFREARREGLLRVTLSVSEANQRACQLYSRLGFRRTKEFHAFIRDGESDQHRP